MYKQRTRALRFSEWVLIHGDSTGKAVNGSSVLLMSALSVRAGVSEIYLELRFTVMPRSLSTSIRPDAVRHAGDSQLFMNR